MQNPSPQNSEGIQEVQEGPSSQIVQGEEASREVQAQNCRQAHPDSAPKVQKNRASCIASLEALHDSVMQEAIDQENQEEEGAHLEVQETREEGRGEGVPY